MGLFRRPDKHQLDQDERFTLADLYHKYHDAVYAYFLHVTYSHEASEELTQETFFQAVLSIHRFRGDSSLKTWLLQVARNIYFNALRHHKKRRNWINEDEDIALFQSAGQDPQQIIQAKELRLSVIEVLRQLPENYRDVLIYKEIEGLTHEEIAMIMNKSVQTSKVLLYRAKQRFKQLYKGGEQYYEESL
jgi:RNA polymerase sigma-70 factor (ECF subfamily)